MVMDGQPSPQSVGREFVRQYYTLLNKAPNHLHRFYNNQSSFIHGGLDTQNREATLVIGQKNIHNKIQQLNFRDCHAKISQVDAQATLGNGVVVQVTGELSNDGQPMRRFTQTFVLAAQSPKNYYVHNDIFRYQDLYLDEENDIESRSENDDDIETENDSSSNSKLVDESVSQQVGQQQQAAQTPIFYSISQTLDVNSVVSGQNVTNQQYSTASTLPNTVQTATQVNGVHEDIIQGLQQQQIGQPSSVGPSATLIVSGNSPSQLIVQQQGILPNIANVSVSSPIPTEVTNANSGSTINQASLVEIETGVNNMTTNDFTVINDAEPKEEYITVEPVEKVEVKAVNEPKTYANLFKSMNTTSSGSGFVPLPPVSHQPSIQSTFKQEIRTESNQSSALPQRNSSRSNNKDFTERRSSNNNQMADSHQLFLGNVPHHATEEELKVIFNKFGPISDLRLHSKSGTKVPGIRNPPNYGFITYEDSESVQNCLSNCPIYFPDNSPEGQKLNVEEKKTRFRTDLPPRQSNMTNSNSGSGGLGGGNSQRPSGGGGGGGQNRSLSNSGGGIIRGNGGNGIMRGSSGGPRPSGGGGGGFNRSDNRGSGSQNRGGNGNSASNTGGNSYGRR